MTTPMCLPASKCPNMIAPTLRNPDSKVLWCGPEGLFARGANEIERLRRRLHEQTLQTQESAGQIRRAIVDTLRHHDVVPEGCGTGHPIEQIVGTCLAVLCGERDELKEIVDKLPKCWRLTDEGELVQDVPVVTGMTLWHQSPAGITKTPPMHSLTCILDEYGMSDRSKYYSTLKAAKAAREKA